MSVLPAIRLSAAGLQASSRLKLFPFGRFRMDVRLSHTKLSRPLKCQRLAET